MIEHRTRLLRPRIPAARLLCAGAATVLALTGAAQAAGSWSVERTGETAIATRSGGLEFTTETALAKEADAAIRAATGCGIAGMGPTRTTKAQFKALLDCKG